MEKKIKLHGGKDDTYAWRKKEKVKKNHKNAISTLSTLRGWNSECPSFLFSFY